PVREPSLRIVSPHDIRMSIAIEVPSSDDLPMRVGKDQVRGSAIDDVHALHMPRFNDAARLIEPEHARPLIGQSPACLYEQGVIGDFVGWATGEAAPCI